MQVSIQGSRERSDADAKIAQFRSQSDMQRETLRQTSEDQRQREREQGQMARSGIQQESEDRRKAAELTSREHINTQDNQTALAIAEAETLSKDHIAVETGTGINPNPSN
jgi:hypothetical protein